MTRSLVPSSRLGAAAVLFATVVLTAACGTDDETADAATTTSSSSSSAPATSSAAAVPTTPAPEASVTPAPAPQSTTQAPPVVDFAMPAVVGMDLQTAQDLIQTNGMFLSLSHDLLGSRNQVVDSNWIVCTQNVAPGQRVTGDVEGAIDLGVVEREESCP